MRGGVVIRKVPIWSHSTSHVTLIKFRRLQQMLLFDSIQTRVGTEIDYPILFQNNRKCSFRPARGITVAQFKPIDVNPTITCADRCKLIHGRFARSPKVFSMRHDLELTKRRINKPLKYTFFSGNFPDGRARAKGRFGRPRKSINLNHIIFDR
jgi:hypothetical protein